MATLYETTYANQYHWAKVRVAANSEAEARDFFEVAVTSAEWLALANEERGMWIEELGDFDHDAYTYRLDEDQSIEPIDEATDKPIGVVTFYDSGSNG
jgi:hypothetical protein